MKKDIKLIELFSGIGGFSKGLADAGFNITEHYFSEIDKHAIANYKYNFPNAKHIGSVTDISGRNFSGIDIITFGSPCQDFSLAGKREGMDGKRSVLILEAIRLITELRPAVFIWENVKGAFSSNSGADFWGILQAFANIGGYRLEWQLLNTKWFLPQNRERIYLVGHLAGSERSFGNVFPIGENDGIPKSEEKFQPRTKDYSTTLTAGTAPGMKRTDTFINVPKISGTLAAGGNSGGLHSDMTTIKIGAIRGRNPDKPSQRIAGQYQEQTLEINEKGIANTLSTVQKDNVVVQLNECKESGGVQPYQQNRIYADYGIMTSLDLDHRKNILTLERIRRLTEIEWERLQGFPDDWTKYGIYQKQVWINKKEGTFKIVQDVHEIPKTQRYKMLGNAVTRDVVEEIGKRLLQ